MLFDESDWEALEALGVPAGEDRKPHLSQEMLKQAALVWMVLGHALMRAKGEYPVIIHEALQSADAAFRGLRRSAMQKAKRLDATDGRN